MPKGSMDMEKVKNSFAEIVKTNAPDFAKKREEIVRATTAKIDVNQAERLKRSSNIVINNIPEDPEEDIQMKIANILAIEKNAVIHDFRPGPADSEKVRPIIATLIVKKA